jgi:glutathione S-transferase
MYRLYYSPATASLCVHWMLIELGVPFELERIDFETEAQKAIDYLRLNPKGQVPTLIIDGKPITESAAILMLLAERHPSAGFAPSPGNAERAAYLELMIYLANALLPAFRNWFYVGDYAGEAHEADVLDHARVRIEAVWDQLDERLADGREFLLGEELRAPDFLATMLGRWSRNMPKPATSWPNLGPYLDRMRARPGFVEVCAREELSEWVG